MNPLGPRRHSWPLLILCIAVPLMVGGSGALITSHNIPIWYAQLRKPAFTPPNWVFGPVWTALYVAMGVASYLVLRAGLKHPRVRPAMSCYLLQLLLNGAWTPVFFGLHLLWVALAVILMLLLAIACTALLFRPISKPASWLIAPYLLWVGYASVLNASIAWMNLPV